MKKLATLLLPISFVFLLTACPPGDPGILSQLEECLNECDRQYAITVQQNAQCEDNALSEFREALEACGQYDKVDVFQNCANTALANFLRQFEECKQVREQALETYENCKKSCWSDIVGGETTED